MKTVLFSLVTLLFVASSCGPRIYKNPDFDDKTARHKIVAIMPADVNIALRPNDMKKITPAQLEEMQTKTGQNIQDNMYSWFLRRSDRFKYTVSFQDISKTNTLLLKNGITNANIDTKTKEELAAILGVDAIISTNTIMQKPMSEGAAVAVGVLLGAWGNTNDVKTSINIHDGKDGSLVWKYDYTAAGSVGSDTQSLVNALMRNASRKFPYNDK